MYNKMFILVQNHRTLLPVALIDEIVIEQDFKAKSHAYSITAKTKKLKYILGWYDSYKEAAAVMKELAWHYAEGCRIFYMPTREFAAELIGGIHQDGGQENHQD